MFFIPCNITMGTGMKLQFTSGAFHGADWQEKLKRCRENTEKKGWEFGIQFHNTAPSQVIENLAGAGVPLSVHAPLNQDRFWNLARTDVQSTFEAIDRNFEEFRRLGIREVVFHAALMSDLSPEAFGHGKSYRECMDPVFRSELTRWPDKPFNRDFTGGPEYARRIGFLLENMRRLNRAYPDFLICLENDFPAYGAMNMYFRDLVRLGLPLCLDTGHLWIAAHQAGLDFQGEVETAVRSGLVRMCHLHSSVYTSAVPADQWSDGHQRLTLENPEMDLPRVVRTLVRGGVDFFVLEIPGADVEEIELIDRWLAAEK